MKSFKNKMYAPTPNPRLGGGYKLLATLMGHGALRNCYANIKTQQV